MLSSVHNEERNLLRLRAWEQRNQEASQAKELNPENVPLFGEPYKVNQAVAEKFNTKTSASLLSVQRIECIHCPISACAF